MGELVEFWRDSKMAYKARCLNRKNKYEPLLIKIGARRTGDEIYEIWEYADWFCYPTKGFAMQKRTNKKMNLDKFINLHSF